ncbi:hypothetical protein JW865_05435 [Candidatus Bathyarchaeota archaeon]|nr:hypothetical protein [Candidatus Bathyarchaeota archaeon]
MSNQNKRRPIKRNYHRSIKGNKCGNCGLFSKTFYCQKNRKVLSPEKEACESWRPRKGIWGKKARKWP